MSRRTPKVNKHRYQEVQLPPAILPPREVDSKNECKDCEHEPSNSSNLNLLDYPAFTSSSGTVFPRVSPRRIQTMGVLKNPNCSSCMTNLQPSCIQNKLEIPIPTNRNVLSNFKAPPNNIKLNAPKIKITKNMKIRLQKRVHEIHSKLRTSVPYSNATSHVNDTPHYYVPQEPSISTDNGSWKEYWDEEVKSSYYYNSVTGEASWLNPCDSI